MSHFRLAKLAETDLVDIRHYIAQDKPTAADRQVAVFFEKFHTLAKYPEMGQSCSEYGPGLRMFSVGNYVVIYRPIVEGIEIARVVSGHRDLTALF